MYTYFNVSVESTTSNSIDLYFLNLDCKIYRRNKIFKNLTKEIIPDEYIRKGFKTNV